MLERPGSLPEFEARFPDEAACACERTIRNDYRFDRMHRPDSMDAFGDEVAPRETTA